MLLTDNKSHASHARIQRKKSALHTFKQPTGFSHQGRLNASLGIIQSCADFKELLQINNVFQFLHADKPTNTHRCMLGGLIFLL